MLVDYHTHTHLCKHAEGNAEDYIRRAVKLGFQEIGCSDHAPMPDNYDLQHRMTLDEFRTVYKPDVLALREKYRGTIDVKFAVEGDFFPGTEAWVKEFNAGSPFDYVIGSVHYLGEWGFDNPIFVHRYEERNIDEVYDQYFDHIRRSAQSGLFDILGHCDLVKKFGHRPTRNLEELLREVFKVVKAANMAVEINTAGLRKPVKEVYPSTQILAILKEYRIPLALGSDAHAPEDVGRDFDVARQLIAEYGGGRVSTFTQRRRVEMKL